MKKTKRALITQQKSQLLQVSEVLSSLDQEEKLKVVERYLTSSLAMYVLLQADKPISATLNKLFDIEIKAANAIDEYMKIYKESTSKPNLHGALAGIFSFIKMGNALPLKTINVKEGTPSKAEKKQNLKTKKSPRIRKARKKVRT